MGEIIAIILISVVIISASIYIIKAKKSGRKCIGCPDSASCKLRKDGKCNCHINIEK